MKKSKKKNSTKKKKNSTYHTNATRKVTKEKPNPFELKINKHKHSVVGQKLRHDRGQPGVSKSRINKRRLKIFQKSTKFCSKSNSFIDKRIGEHKGSMSRDDLVIARMAEVRRKKYKKNIYNLNDEEELTHFGKPLLDTEIADKPINDSDDDDEAELDANFENETNFLGGFLTKKADSEIAKSRNEVLDDIIAESKKKKEEKKIEKEETDDLTDQLDKEWQEMQSIVSCLRKKNDDDVKIKNDTYDMTVLELKFERKVTAPSNLKSEDELKKAEENKIKKMQEERILRMNPPGENVKSQFSNDLSADSMCDNLDIDDEFHFKPEEFNAEMLDTDLNTNDDSESNEDDDIDVSDSDIEMSDNEEMELQSDGHISSSCSGSPSKQFSIPQTVEEFTNLVKDNTDEEVSSMIDSIIKKHHVGYKAENRSLLEKFFEVIVKYFSGEWIDASNLGLLNRLIPHLYVLAQLSPVKTGLAFQSILIENYEIQCSKSSTCHPPFDTLMMLKLASVLYSTSDYRHPVITPAFLHMSKILSTPYRVTFYNILSRLFLSNLVLEYVLFSKRLSTEPIWFLCDVIYMSSSDVVLKPYHKPVFKNKNFLFIDSQVEDELQPISLKMFFQLNDIENVDRFKSCIINSAVKLLNKFAQMYCNETSFSDIFGDLVKLLEHLPVNLYPAALTTEIIDLKTFLNEHLNKPRKHLKFPGKRPPMVKMMEPVFEGSIGHDKKETVAKKLREEKQLSQKIRKEERGIIREIRRDAQFIAQEKLKIRIAADDERKMKVNKLHRELAEQEGEYKKMMKKKK